MQGLSGKTTKTKYQEFSSKKKKKKKKKKKEVLQMSHIGTHVV